jgi:NADP-dependent 3-hydroxy acid dehydrogenase YdfG
MENHESLGDSLTNKAVLITGGTTGIGRATALLLAYHGAKIFIFGRHGQELEDTLNDAAAKGIGSQIQGTTADVTNKEDILRVFKESEKWFGKPLDILINNAALAFDSIMEGTFEDWKYITDVNIVGYLACAREAIDRMKERKKGHIVNIGSISAAQRKADSSVYVATKAAIQGFSESLRKEINPLGIKVTLIEPGLVGTDMTEDTPPEKQREKEENSEMLKAEDIAACVLYTLSQPERCDVVNVQIRPHLQKF